MKKVSIIVPVYNMADRLEKCISSLTDQTYKNIEIILVNDGSKDGSKAICEALSEQYENVSAFHTENQGSGPARNYGISKAVGDYLYFPDADDFLLPTAIEKLVETAEREDAELVVFGYASIDTKGKEKSVKKYPDCIRNATDIKKDYSDYYIMSKPMSIQGAPWNKFFKASVIKSAHIEYPPLRRHQDDAFIARYMNAINGKIVFISDVLYKYYANDLSKQWDKYPKDYIDAVTGLYEDRKKNILVWSESDEKTHDITYAEYICNVIKALELSFSPKYGFDKKMRLDWIKKCIEGSLLTSVKVPPVIGRYQKTVMKRIINGNYGALYRILRIKVFAEKNKLLSAIKSN